MKLKGYIEGIVLVVVLWFVFQWGVQPILIHIDPMFADQPVDRVRRGPQTPAQVAGIVTFVAGTFVYYSGRVMYSRGVLRYLKTIRGLILVPIIIAIPNKYIPKWFVAENADLDDW